MGETLVKVENVSKKFCRNLKRSLFYGLRDLGNDLLLTGCNAEDRLRKNEFWAVKDICFELKRGQCLGLIGRNGAGKTTLLRMLNGLIKPDAGRIELNGRVCALIALGAGFKPILTGSENIYVNASVMGLSKKEIDSKLDEIVAFSELEEFIDTPVQNYSSGMQMRLGFSIAAALEPDILLLDEVLAVGDAGFRIKCINRIAALMEKTAVIFVSHQISQISRICTDLMLLDKGDVVYKGRELSKGIEYYYSQNKKSTSTIHGNGKASIHEVELIKGNQYRHNRSASKKNLVINYFDDISFVVFFSLVPHVKSAIMNIAFHKDSSGVAQCYSKNCDFEITNKSEIIKIMVTIPNIQLNPGIYSISINIVDDSRRHLLVRQDSVKQLHVTGEFLGDCPVQMKGFWKYI